MRASDSATDARVMRLEYQPPYDFPKLLAFFRTRQLEGVEMIDDDSYSRTVVVPLPGGGEARGWIRVRDEADEGCLVLEVSDTLSPVAEQVAERVRRVFDLDCDPDAVTAGIASLDEVVPGAVVHGTRLPGAFEPFEIACRAVLGQQVSVRAANKMAARIVAQYGTDVETGIEGLSRAFPTAASINAMEDLAAELGPLGVIGNRSRCIAEIARLVLEGELDLSADADAERVIARLVEIKGIGPWTANYIAMRALSYADAFLETDIGIKHALPDLTPKQRLQAAEAWRPWRSYANISLWNSLFEIGSDRSLWVAIFEEEAHRASIT